MKLAVSNIAWPPQDRDAAYAILRDHGVTGLEIAPGLLFDGADDAFIPSQAELDDAVAAIGRAGLTLVSMQSLLFGVEGAGLFGDEDERRRLLQGLGRAIDLAGRLRIPNLVFGSPKQRVIPPGMPYEQAEHIAIDLFRRVGDIAIGAGTRLAVEPNPAAYGTNFLTHMADVIAFVGKVDHPGISMVFDLGALRMNGDYDDIERLAEAAMPFISHVHFSEAHLAPAPATEQDAARAFAALARAGYAGWHSIEMRAPDQAPLAALTQAVGRFTRAARCGASLEQDR